MRSVGIKVLKNKLSEYVRLAAGGETVLVTDRDRVVAEIVPPQSGRSPLLADAMLAEAVREGWLRPAVLSHRAAHCPALGRSQSLASFPLHKFDRSSIRHSS
jgi:antitoxin (DNA-binding transcriptional repressor) of toxin-antitoxin stability system